MARKPTTKVVQTSTPTALTTSREEAKRRISDRIEKGQELLQKQINSSDTFDEAKHEFHKWDAFNTELLKQLFTTDELSKEYSWWGIGTIGTGYESLGQLIAEHQENVVDKVRRLDSIVERLELFPIPSSTLQPQSESDRPTEHAPTRSKKVFVVHGRDELAKTSLEVFLHEIGLEPIVLHRQADEGLTIIEKFEKHSDVGYAFILLTPDEIAYLSSEESIPDEQRKKEYRARPNVIFEFGYFVGRLGRPRVCCIHSGDVVVPSDLQGMVYKKYSQSIEEVAYSIMKDLKACGYDVS